MRAYRVDMTRIRAVLFDFDGTLAYMQPSHWALYAEAARAAGLDVSEDALAAETVDRAWEPWMTPLGVAHPDASASQGAFRVLRADLASDRIRAALGSLGGDEASDTPPSDTVAMHALMRDVAMREMQLYEAGQQAALLEEDAARYVLFDDALPALERLAAVGVESIVLSNHIWTLPEIVEALGAGEQVAGVVTSARAGYRKPHPEIFAEALRLTSASPDEIVMVGDSVSADMRGAEAAGMHAVFIDRDGTRELPDDVRRIRSLVDIPIEWPPA